MYKTTYSQTHQRKGINMATPSPWEDIDDKFCLCYVCLERLKEPKLLPCLHRYCKYCLNSIIQRSDDVIKCPECREEIQIPTNGVDGFRTDFYSKSLVEYVQIQQSLKSDEIRECYGCSKHLIVAAYCFKCKDFLCKDCHNFHITNKMMKDHQMHTLSLDDIEAENITIEKLASMRDAPRCNNHPEKISELHCKTCNNIPVCMACTYGEHKGHNLHEVNALAKLKKEKLAKQLKGLKEIEKNKMPMTSEQAKEMLTLNVSIEKEKGIKMHNEKDTKIMRKIQNIEEMREQVKQEKQNTERKMCDSLRREKEKEIEEVTKKYDEILKMKKVEINNSFLSQKRSLEKELTELREKRERFEKDKREFLESIEKKQEENIKHFDNLKNRFKILNVMASSILASDNNWLAVQCIPDMCTAAANLMKDLEKGFPELTTLTDVTGNYRQFFFGKPNVTKISEHFDKKITVYSPYRFLCDMTSSGDGNIVISGVASDGPASFIIVIDMNGRILEAEKLNRGIYWSHRYCQFLSQHKVATVCKTGEIGLFNLRDGSYIKKNISDVISIWPENWELRCVAADFVNNHILVGGWKSREVYVFDDQLNYLRTLTLPKKIHRLNSMTVSDGHLLVCDFHREKCYVTTMDGLESKMVSEMMKPKLEGSDLGPCEICSDKDGFIYVLWTGSTQSYIFQYNPDGSQILATKTLEPGVSIVTVVETSLGEKLVAASPASQTVYLYNLITED